MKFETVIGLEIHAQLATKSKMFCSCSNKFGSEPNTNICPICTGQPGVLPVTNKKAVELAIKTALALKCRIEPHSVFARKHYFYPDLPKDFQISQYELPLATGGYLEIEVDGQKRKIGITRVHLEEDAGKLVHVGAARIMGAEESLVDYNRTGTPLMEIVSEPDLRSPREAAVYTQTLANLLRYIMVCDAKMEEGSLRCDANLSIREVGNQEFGVKTEVKNMNSFKAIEKALLSEEKRHHEVIEEGGQIVQETRFFDDVTETTTGMRSKEFAHDYRYFPEPDLVPIEPPGEWIEEIKKTIGELPAQRRERFIKDYQLPPEMASLLIANKSMADYLEETVKLFPKATAAANWLTGDITAYMNENKKDFSQLNLTPAQLAEILRLIDDGTLSNKIAKTVLFTVLKTGKQVKDVIAESGLTQISNEDELKKIVQEVINNNPKQVEQFKAGKETVMMYLVGQVMKLSKGRANPALANKLLTELLK
ncbi:MAG: Asp-tRNA(Asn)/Glu-tRNA(Gln) amidotransferase subunit GatB [Candidatus Margulisbacteria bacterium]|nr:Asp-tRNA(Asn)/Glu-tRNA(Gln) amidotransferase subunit GatB [Candidatus Margulisiibacteriota bacterium]